MPLSDKGTPRPDESATGSQDARTLDDLDNEDLENQTLFSNTTDKFATYGVASLARTLISRQPVRDAMTYHTQDLASWRSLVYVSYTVWNRKSLWLTAFKLLMLSIFIGVLVVLTVPDPAALKVSKFASISSFLRVFVGLLLGFFMSASVNRWWACVESFSSLCGVVRKLQMTLSACGVPEEEIKECLRYGFLSVRLLHIDLHIQALPLEDQEAAMQRRWVALRNGEDFDSAYGKLTSREADDLQKISDPSSTMWIWIGTLIGRFAEEGLIRTLPAPIFARCMVLAAEGLDKILRVRSVITVQAPYIYVQMLASLVHINNIVNALSFGMTSGVVFGTLLQYYQVPFFSRKATSSELALDGQSFLVSFVFSCFGPFVYQALLEVSIAIAQPFSNSDAIVPTVRILHMLERDLSDAIETARFIQCKTPRTTKPSREQPSKEQVNRTPRGYADCGGAEGGGGGDGDGGGDIGGD